MYSRVNRSAKPGDIIPFGRYPQTAGGADRTPIQWWVLQTCGSELFVLSEYILDCKRYHGEYADITWRNCNVRQWLNDEFYNAAFTAAEQEFVKTTHCIDSGAGSPDTEDKIFLLSVNEIRTFTNVSDEDGIRRRTVGTDFAKTKKADGCHLYVYDKGIEKDYVVENGAKHGCSWWWSRTQSQIKDGSSPRATFIGPRSNIKTYGRVDIARYGVRPALKLNLRC